MKELSVCENLSLTIHDMEEMIAALYYKDENEKILKILKKNMKYLKENLEDKFKIKKLELLEKNIQSYEKGLVCYSDYFFEQCIYILMCIEKGVC